MLLGRPRHRFEHRAVNTPTVSLPARWLGASEGVSHHQIFIRSGATIQLFPKNDLVIGARRIEEADRRVASRGGALPDHRHQRDNPRAARYQQQWAALLRAP